MNVSSLICRFVFTNRTFYVGSVLYYCLIPLFFQPKNLISTSWKVCKEKFQISSNVFSDRYVKKKYSLCIITISLFYYLKSKLKIDFWLIKWFLTKTSTNKRFQTLGPRTQGKNCCFYQYTQLFLDLFITQVLLIFCPAITLQVGASRRITPIYKSRINLNLQKDLIIARYLYKLQQELELRYIKFHTIISNKSERLPECPYLNSNVFS